MIETVVKVDGMMCGMCESHVNDAVRKAFPEAKKVASSHTKGQTVIHSEQALDEAKNKPGNHFIREAHLHEDPGVRSRRAGL